MNVFKKYIRCIHRWLGLLIGLLVFVIAGTACVYAFQEEIQNYTDDYRFCKRTSRSSLLPESIQKIAVTALPNLVLHSIKYFENNHTVEVTFYNSDPTYYYKMFIHPETGSVLHIQNMDEGFFNFILKGHMYLWLPAKAGSILVRYVTIIFLVMVITGFILWLPKSIKYLKKRAWIHWNHSSSWKRKNWTLHSVTGFYSFAFAILFICTGLVWVLPEFASFYYKVFGGQKSIIYRDPYIAPTTRCIDKPLDSLYQFYYSQKNFASLELHPPVSDSSSILVVTNPDYSSTWRSNYHFFNPNNLQEVSVDHIWSSFKNATNADKIMRLNYDIHIGSVLGFPGKIIAFLSSLLIASLPITGCLIWFGRRSKNTLSQNCH